MNFLWLVATCMTAVLCTAPTVVSAQQGVSLSLRGAAIENNSFVNVDDIGDGNEVALLCHTDKLDCCRYYYDGLYRQGHWYYPNESLVGPLIAGYDSGLSSFFYRNRGDSVVRLQRYGSPLVRGQFRCQVPDASGVNQTLLVNILDIGSTQINPSGSHICIAEESFNIQCSVDINQGLPSSVSYPTIQWFYGPSNSTLPSGVTLTAVTNSPGSHTYSSTLQFSSLQSFHGGMYTCRVGGNEALAATSNVIIVSITSAGGAAPIAGRTYILICDISGIEYLEATSIISYEWTKNNGTRTSVGTNSSSLTFSTLRLSDAGGYTCDVTINSQVYSYIEYLDIQVPPPRSISISSDPVSPIRPIGSDTRLTCTVELSPAVDVPVTVSIQITDPSGNALMISTPMSSGSVYKTTANVSSFWRDQSGNYTCSSTVTSASPFHVDSDMKIEASFITTGPYLLLKGEVQANNSAIFITGIGETLYIGPNNNGLQCVTDRMPCCRSAGIGEWLFPNGSIVGTSGSGSALYRNRGFNDGTINLNNRADVGNIQFPTGLYCCVVPNANDVNEIHCVTIVSVVISPSGSTTAGENYILECSANGALATFQWFDESGNEVTAEDGSKRAITNSPFNSLLQFSPLHLSHGGPYTCYATVQGVNDSKSFLVSVTAPTPTVRLVSNSDRLNPIISGGNLSLTCSVEFISAVDRALTIDTVWTTPNGQGLVSSTSPEASSHTRYTSTVTFSSIEAKDAGEYTCSVSIEKGVWTTATRFIAVGDTLIQLRLSRTDDCQLWTPEKATIYRNAVETALVEAIERRCKCSFPIENLLEDSFSCDKSPQATIYRNTLVGTQNFDATEIIAFIQDWVYSEPNIKVEWFTVGVDGNCPVAIESLEQPECGQ